MDLDFLKNLGDLSFISAFGAKKALSVVRYHLESVCKHEVRKYEAYFNPSKNKLHYTVWYPDQNNLPEKYQGSEVCAKGTHLYIQGNPEKFVNTVMSFIEDKIPKNAEFDAAVLSYDNDVTTFYVFVKIDGIKQTIKHEIK